MDLYSAATISRRPRAPKSPCLRAATLGHTSSSGSSSTSPRRGIHIDEFTRANSGVWYYQVDIAVYSADASNSSGSYDNNGSGDESDASGYASPRCSMSSLVGGEPEVQYYSVLRRYNDFLHLYEQVKLHLATWEVFNGNGGASVATALNALPAFPDKELISPSVFSLLWRMSSSTHVLQERRVKFQKLLQFIEHHSVARQCPAFTDFLGQPPQRQDGGYVSLKEYTSQNWFSSFKQLAKEKEQRKRHYTMDSEHLSSLLDQTRIKTPTALPMPMTPLRARLEKQAAQTAHERTQYALLGKRRRRAKVGNSAVRAAAEEAATLLLLARRDAAAQVGGTRPLFKKCKSFHRSQREQDGSSLLFASAAARQSVN